MEKRIQEDNLQQLALFSEYGRMALNKEQEMTSGGAGILEDIDEATLGSEAQGDGTTSGPSAVGFAAKAMAGVEARAQRVAAGSAESSGAELSEAAKGAVPLSKQDSTVSKDWVERPFQRLEFLVRDWQVCAHVPMFFQDVEPYYFIFPCK